MAESAQWNFFTNHAHVLICLARDPEQSLREVALVVGITERAVQRIVADLEAAGYLTREKKGRQNHYQLHTALPLRHEVESHCSVGDLLEVLIASSTDLEEEQDRLLDNWTVGEHGSEI